MKVLEYLPRTIATESATATEVGADIQFCHAERSVKQCQSTSMITMAEFVHGLTEPRSIALAGPLCSENVMTYRTTERTHREGNDQHECENGTTCCVESVR